MKKTVSSLDFLRNCFRDAKEELAKHGELHLSYEPVKRKKTKRQLGFVFGGLLSTIQRWQLEQGIDSTIEELKDALYQTCSKGELRYDLRGNEYIYRKRLSEMDKKETSEFINNVIEFIDNTLDGCILTPDLRYTWTLHITKDDIEKIEFESETWRKVSPEFLSYQRKQACISCGVFGCEAHHLRDEGGVALKSPDYLTIPLCRKCHKYLHDTGERSFYDSISKVINNVPIKDFCKLNYKKWLFRC